MTEYRVAENGIKKDPHELLTKEVLEAAFKEDLGLEWNLTDFEIKDFTKKGDNYVCMVTGVSCKGALNDEEKKTYYVAKLNPLHQSAGMDSLVKDLFEREGTFLTEVAMKLNKILKDISYPQITFPECVYQSLKEKREILLSRDLRQKGYKMFDRKVGMGFDHSTLVIKELAKLHASSFIFKMSLEKESVLDLYPFMYDKWLLPDSESRPLFCTVLKNSINTSVMLIDQLKEYVRQAEWLKNLKNIAMDSYGQLIINSPENMRVICHGDCWNNNVLFRYDEEGNPIDVALLDLQVCRFASLGLDLNYFFITSLTGDVRKKYYDQLLSIYYEEFEKVMNAANMEMPFTKDEFRKEVEDKMLFGVLTGLIVLPILILEGEDVPDLFNVKDDEMEDCVKKNVDLMKKMMDTNPTFKQRFLAVLDDVVEKGLID